MSNSSLKDLLKDVVAQDVVPEDETEFTHVLLHRDISLYSSDENTWKFIIGWKDRSA